MMMPNRDERGAVALITTIIISILLAIITTGLVTLMVSELRQSNDSEQSIRAYYAAQSGVEDGIGKVIDSLALPIKIGQTCGTPLSSNTNLDPANPGSVGWTCQQISYSGSPTGNLPVADKSVQIDPGPSPASPYRSVKLEWDLKARPAAGFGNYFNAPGNFPDGNNWGFAAPMELAVIEYPKAAFDAAAAGRITITNMLAVPRSSGGNMYTLGSLRGGNPVSGRCNQNAASYHCEVILGGLNAAGDKNYMFRLRSRYVGSDYRMTFWSNNTGNGTQILVSDGTATIDITAKAGDAFRRVVYKVPYERGAASGLDYVIYSDEDICKDLTTINGAVQADGC